MALSYQQSRQVRATIPALKQHGEQIATTFYRNMLTANPSLQSIFNDVNLANGRQPRALTATMLHFASNLHDISSLTARLERTCHKHCSLGIRPGHYEIVAKYLIDAFGEVLGPAMTEEVRVAWTKAYWVLARMLIGREDQMYRAFDPAWKGWRKFRIVKKIREADDVYSFYMVPVDGKPLPSFLPGQYVSIRFDVRTMGCTQPRQYALSDAPRPEYYRITVKRDRGTQVKKAGVMMSVNPGVVSGMLVDEKTVGDELEVSHPAGEVFLDEHAAPSMPLVLISAGVGVTPMVSMLNAVVEAQPGRPVSFIHGSQREMPFEEHVRDIHDQHPNVSLNIFRSRLAEVGLVGVDYGYDARMDLAAVSAEDLHLNNGAAEYYICGPEQFMVEMADYLVLQGVSLGRVKFSTFTTGDLQGKGK